MDGKGRAIDNIFIKQLWKNLKCLSESTPGMVLNYMWNEKRIFAFTTGKDRINYRATKPRK